MHTPLPERRTFWLSDLFQAVSRLVRPRPDSMQGGGSKLMPISDILSRAGREPRSPE